MTAPRFPLEILLQIFDHVQQEESPVSWSLVCKTFCNISRQSLFREVAVGFSIANIEGLVEILQSSLEILSYVEVLRVVHKCKIDNRFSPVYPYPDIAPTLDLFYQYAERMTELRITPGNIFSNSLNPPTSWQDFPEQTQSALLRILSAPRVRTIRIDFLTNVPAIDYLGLPRLTQFTIHDTRFRGGPGEHPKVPDPEASQSNLRVLQISDGDPAGTIPVIEAQIAQSSRLERLSIASTSSYTRWSASEMFSIQRIISLNRDSLTQIDLCLDDYDREMLPSILDLSQLTCLRILTCRVQYFCDTSAYLHLPSPTPNLVSRLSTLPAHMAIEVRLTFAVHFLSLSSPVTMTDLEALDIALVGKNVRLHIWVSPNINTSTRSHSVICALEKQLWRLQESKRLFTYRLLGRQTDSRFWLKQRKD